MTLEDFIKNALSEDIGDGDHTSLACVPANAVSSAQLLIKEDGILAGMDVAKVIFSMVNPQLTLKINKSDGEPISKGDIAFTVNGKAQSILAAERLVLNCMQRMSGIATATNRLNLELSGLKTKVLDTRKTTPGMRLLEKMAVKIGGGSNHRMGLYDMIMIKDNHVDYAGGIEKAIETTHTYLQENNLSLPIEIEARNLEEVKKILAIGHVNRIMLDNFSVADTKIALELIDGKYETEASGGINLNTIRSYAECGVDYVSVGAITHSVKSLDMSLKALAPL